MKLPGHPLPTRFGLGALAILTMAASAPGALFAQDVPLKPTSASGQLAWTFSDVAYVKREPKESGASANDQPVTIPPDLLYSQLLKLQVVLPGGAETLFGKDELKPLAGAISEALALAGPNEDLVLRSTAKREGFLTDSRTITARLFWQDGALQIICHDARAPFYAQVPDDGAQAGFGSRDSASQVRIQCPGATRKRSDWLAVPMGVTAPAPVAAPVATPAPVAAPVATPAPVAAPAPARDNDEYAQQEERLRWLKHLHDDKLITDQEFQKKRTEIMNAF
jgi:hypothetical protein